MNLKMQIYFYLPLLVCFIILLNQLQIRLKLRLLIEKGDLFDIHEGYYYNPRDYGVSSHK